MALALASSAWSDMTEQTNLAVLTPSRKRLQPGDIFAMLPPDGKYLFGSVIATDARVGPMEKLVLIYIYASRSDDKQAGIDLPLVVEDLLVPPTLTNRLPWSRGYFESIGTREISELDVMRPHWFKNRTYGTYFDAHSMPLSGPPDVPERLVGRQALNSYRTIDDSVSSALGIPLVP